MKFSVSDSGPPALDALSLKFRIAFNCCMRSDARLECAAANLGCAGGPHLVLGASPIYTLLSIALIYGNL
jgi:hypothetical protein